MTAVLAYESYLAKHPSRPLLAEQDDQATMAMTSETAVPIWIDTDPACGVATTTDVDDCWALLTALRTPELHVVGMSTVFGNQPGERLAEFVRDILPKIEKENKADERALRVFTGSLRADDDRRPTPASEAMASALHKTKLIIIALGPLTNVATLINTHPDLTAEIRRIIMVAGKHPGQLFHPGHQWWFHFGDFNVSHDPDAAQAVLSSGVPITLIPFEVATKLTITRSDLETLGPAMRQPSGCAR
jgi:purine nucleosidase